MVSVPDIGAATFRLVRRRGQRYIGDKRTTPRLSLATMSSPTHRDSPLARTGVVMDSDPVPPYLVSVTTVRRSDGSLTVVFWLSDGGYDSRTVLASDVSRVLCGIIRDFSDEYGAGVA